MPLRLTFTTGEQRTVDFGPFLHHVGHPAIRDYVQEDHFRQLRAFTEAHYSWNESVRRASAEAARRNVLITTPELGQPVTLGAGPLPQGGGGSRVGISVSGAAGRIAVPAQAV